MIDGEEKNIVEKAIGGESSAFGWLYDKYQPQIYRFVLLKVSRREEAEDLTHQVFLKAWVNIKSYRHRGFPFSSWLYRIARNLVIDFYKSQRDSIDIETVPEHRLAAGPDMAESAHRDLELERVRAGIKNLKIEYQDVIILRFVDELSVEETAQAMKRSVGAVKILQHRALAKLKEILHQEDS